MISCFFFIFQNSCIPWVMTGILECTVQEKSYSCSRLYSRSDSYCFWQVKNMIIKWMKIKPPFVIFLLSLPLFTFYLSLCHSLVISYFTPPFWIFFLSYFIKLLVQHYCQLGWDPGFIPDIITSIIYWAYNTQCPSPFTTIVLRKR